MQENIIYLRELLKKEGVKCRFVVACTACVALQEENKSPISRKNVEQLMTETSFLMNVQNNQAGSDDQDDIIAGAYDAFLKRHKTKYGGVEPFYGFIKIPDDVKTKVVSQIEKRKK